MARMTTMRPSWNGAQPLSGAPSSSRSIPGKGINMGAKSGLGGKGMGKGVGTTFKRHR
ncbi:MAG: hypothetical protein Q9203_000799, partial [Teloschistes exilis]